MTDNEIRGIILQFFYENRRRGKITPRPEDFNHRISQEDIDRICKQLDQYKLINWEGFYHLSNIRGIPESKIVYGYGEITAIGTDIIELNKTPPIGMTFTQNISISHSQAVQIGTGNVQSFSFVIENFISQIEQANASEYEKKEAKSRLKAFLEHPLVNTVLGVLALELIKRLGE